MDVYDLVKPGTWLNGLDQQTADNIARILSDIESNFFLANISLHLYEIQNATDKQSIPTKPPSIESIIEERQKEKKRALELQPEICKRYNLNPDNLDDRKEIKFIIESEIKKENWALGEIPYALTSKISSIYVNSFIHAIDMIYRLLSSLKNIDNHPSGIDTALSLMAKHFPTIHEIRNSIQHMDERSQWIGKNRRPLKPLPLKNNLINSPVGALLKSPMIGNKLISTLGDGSYGEIEISHKSMKELQTIVQETFNSYKWTGPKGHLPFK
ncbi:hypothetical protein [Klebsiella variicola]|uniref:hypothetical protein n=1 Tax=Klebsiella variicola TaxID=244366 RepID=UPI00115C26A8|nr:hypothetical protein [Klebsiella variicola]EIY5061775.1 hypothetical protein [Klebsiella variicola]